MSNQTLIPYICSLYHIVIQMLYNNLKEMELSYFVESARKNIKFSIEFLEDATAKFRITTFYTSKICIKVILKENIFPVTTFFILLTLNVNNSIFR